MSGITKILSGFSLAGLFILAGCQSTGGATTMPSDAVGCDKCKTVWVKHPLTVGGGKEYKVIGYTTTGTMVCPKCRTEVDSFFKGHGVKHVCSECGGTMDHCKTH